MDLIKKYYAAVTSVIIFIIYLFTLAPTVIQIDSGELASVQATLGIAHPTGYPLFSIIGYLFLKYHSPLQDFTGKSSCSCLVFARSFPFYKDCRNPFFASYHSAGRKDKTEGEETKSQVSFTKDQAMIATVSGSLFLALSKTYWMQSTSVEVYSLQIFLFLLIILVSLKTFYKEKNNNWDWLPVGLVYAFGFANHMTSMLAIPFSAILFFAERKFLKAVIL